MNGMDGMDEVNRMSELMLELKQINRSLDGINQNLITLISCLERSIK